MEDQQQPHKLTLIAYVVSSYLRRNSISTDQIGAVVASVTRALGDAEKLLAGGGIEVGPSSDSTDMARPEPAVSVRSSVKPDFIVCLECGKKVKTLKRHLQSAHGLDTKQYRERWGLKKDYPMTAPAYSERRSTMARDLGLGRKAGHGRKAAKASPRRARRKKPAAQSAAE